MFPLSFDYVAPESIDDVFSEIADAGENGKLLAGGQSLIPALRNRSPRPVKVIDLGRVKALREICVDDSHIVLGAMATHDALARSDLVMQHARLLHDAVVAVADPQVRNRGTIGGALVHGDPAGDIGAAALALGAELVVLGEGGVARRVKAEDFFLDAFVTDVRYGELLAQILIPKHTGWGARYEKFVRVAHQWATVAVAATVQVRDGCFSEARIGLVNMGPTPVRANTVEQALVDRAVTEDTVRDAVAWVADGTDPPSDLNGSSDHRRHLARVLTRRAVLAAARV